MSVGCAGSNQSRTTVSVPPLLPPHLVSPLGAAVGWHWELSQHSSAPFGTPATDPLLTTRRFLVGSTMCLGTTKGVSPKPLDQRFQGYREPKTRQVPGKSCPASQAVCHPTRCWGPHLVYTWNLVFHKHQISLDFQLPGGLAGSCWLREEPPNSLNASEGVNGAEEKPVWMIDSSSLI